MLRRLILDLPLGGGVWRLKLMDSYSVSSTKTDFLVLASCMHAGVRILRVCYDDDDDAAAAAAATAPSSRAGWTVAVVARFEAGHASMVYCCDFRREGEQTGAWAYTVVSTSFYDKKICTWGFVDAVRRRRSEEMRESGTWEGLGTTSSVSSASTSTAGWVKEEGEWKLR